MTNVYLDFVLKTNCDGIFIYINSQFTRKNSFFLYLVLIYRYMNLNYAPPIYTDRLICIQSFWKNVYTSKIYLYTCMLYIYIIHIVLSIHSLSFVKFAAVDKLCRYIGENWNKIVSIIFVTSS